MDRVELRPAFEWTCDSCGMNNYCSPIIQEMDEESREELVDQHEIEDAEYGDFVLIPEKVRCQHCKAVFETENPGISIE